MHVFARTLREKPQLFGVLHLPALPGAPRPAPGLDALINSVLADARAYREGGADGLIMENYGDAPFSRGAVDPVVLTFMTRIGLAVVAEVEVPLGVNVLRNDALGALAVAAATGARLIRVNVLAGVVATDQGFIEGNAGDLLRARKQLEPALAPAVLADVDVKHGTVLWGASIAGRAGDLVERAGADGLIVTGAATGAAPSRSDVEAVLAACPSHPVVVGSGVTAENAPALLDATHGAIVGTAVKERRRIDAPVDPRRVEALVKAAHRAWGR